MGSVGFNWVWTRFDRVWVKLGRVFNQDIDTVVLGFYKLFFSSVSFLQSFFLFFFWLISMTKYVSYWVFIQFARVYYKTVSCFFLPCFICWCSYLPDSFGLDLFEMGFTGFVSGLIGFDSSGFGFEPGIGRARVRYIYFFLVWFFVSFCCFVIFRSAGREEKKKAVVGRRRTANRNEKKKKGPAAFLTGLLFSFSCSSLLLPESLAAMVFFSLFF